MMSKSRVRSLKRVWLTVLPVFLLGADGAGDAAENKAVSIASCCSYVIHIVRS